MELTDIWLAKPKICRRDADFEFLSGFVGSMPVVFSKRQYEQERTIHTLSRMPFRRNENSWRIKQIHTRSIDKNRLSPVCSPVILTKEKLDFWDIYAATVNCDDKTFIFRNFELFTKSFKNISKVINEYKYKTLFQLNDNFNRVLDLLQHPKRQIVFTISIYNLESFCPIFNHEKVDGLGIAIEAVDLDQTASSGRPASAQNIYIIMSNYKDNVFYMDGVTIQKHNDDLNLNKFSDQYQNILSIYKKEKSKNKKKFSDIKAKMKISDDFPERMTSKPISNDIWTSIHEQAVAVPISDPSISNDSYVTYYHDMESSPSEGMSLQYGTRTIRSKAKVSKKSQHDYYKKIVEVDYGELEDRMVELTSADRGIKIGRMAALYGKSASKPKPKSVGLKIKKHKPKKHKKANQDW